MPSNLASLVTGVLLGFFFYTETGRKSLMKGTQETMKMTKDYLEKEKSKCKSKNTL